MQVATLGVARGADPMPQLDALRAFAVFAVLVHHFLPAELLTWQFAQLPWGFLGVRLFFVISGFLITGILLRARDEAAAAGVLPTTVLFNFYARRCLRIFPLYYFVVLSGLALNLPPMREEWIWLVSYTLNLRISALGWYPENISHFWSLAVEEQFYLLWPFVVLFAPKPLLMRIAIGMVVIGIGYRALALANGFYGPAIYVFTTLEL